MHVHTDRHLMLNSFVYVKIWTTRQCFECHVICWRFEYSCRASADETGAATCLPRVLRERCMAATEEFDDLALRTNKLAK